MSSRVIRSVVAHAADNAIGCTALVLGPEVYVSLVRALHKSAVAKEESIRALIGTESAAARHVVWTKDGQPMLGPWKIKLDCTIPDDAIVVEA